MNKYFLFILPIFLGMPEIGIHLGFINLRVDDLICYALFLINLNLVPHLILRGPRMIKAFVAFSSIILLIIIPLTFFFIRPVLYDVIKFIGSLPYLFVLPLIKVNRSNYVFFIRGTIIGFLLFISQIGLKYKSLLLDSYLDIHQFKAATSFSTFNPNSTAVLAIIFGGLLFIYYLNEKRKIVLFLSIISFSIPLLVFSRGMSIGVIIFVILFFGLKGGWFKSVKFNVLILSIFLIIFNIQKNESSLASEAISINLKTGEGFSSRFELWGQGLSLIPISPLIGFGFGSDKIMYTKYFNGGLSHNILLHYAIEMGLAGLFIFIAIIYYQLKTNYRMWKIHNHLHYLFQFCFLIGIVIADMSSQLLYFNKYAYYIFFISSSRYYPKFYTLKSKHIL